MPKYLAVLDVNVPPDLNKIMSLEAPEADRVWELRSEGVLQEIYLASDRSAAIIVLTAEGKSEAQAAIDSLPMVAEAVLSPRVVELAAWPEMTRMLKEHGEQHPDWWPE